jgi:hypothetical protein
MLAGSLLKELRTTGNLCVLLSVLQEHSKFYTKIGRRSVVKGNAPFLYCCLVHLNGGENQLI